MGLVLGEQEAVILGCRWRSSKKKKTLGLNVKCSVLDEENKEQHVYGDIWFTEKAAYRARAQVKAIGVDVGDKDTPVADIVNALEDALNGGRLSGNKVIVNLKEDSYGGHVRVKIGFFGRDTRTDKTKPTPEKLKQVAELLKGAASGQKQSVEDSDETFETGAEDIPF